MTIFVLVSTSNINTTIIILSYLPLIKKILMKENYSNENLFRDSAKNTLEKSGGLSANWMAIIWIKWNNGRSNPAQPCLTQHKIKFKVQVHIWNMYTNPGPKLYPLFNLRGKTTQNTLSIHGVTQLLPKLILAGSQHGTTETPRCVLHLPPCVKPTSSISTKE